MKKLGGLALLVFLAGCATQPLPPPAPPPPPPPPPVIEAAPVTANRVAHPPAPAASADITVQGARTGTSAHVVIALDQDEFSSEMLAEFSGNMTRQLSERQISASSATSAKTVALRVVDKRRIGDVAALLDNLCTPAEGEARQFHVTRTAEDAFTVTPDDGYLRSFAREKQAQVMASLMQRLDQVSPSPPRVAAYGADRIVIDVPGYRDLDRVRALIAPSNRTEIHLVDEGVSGADIAAGRIPADDIVLDQWFDGRRPAPFAIRKEVLLAGDRISGAEETRDAFMHEPVLEITFDDEGTRILGEITRKYDHHRVAVVIDGVLVEAPMIFGPILEGRMQLAGVFTQASAVKLATLLYPTRARLRIVEIGLR